MSSLSKLVSLFHESLLVSSSLLMRFGCVSWHGCEKGNYVKEYHDFVWFKFKIFDIGEKSIFCC